MANTKITSRVIADNAVTSSAIADGAITEAKLASGVGGVAGIVSSADATAITIDSSENVGIGTSNPDNKLHIEGPASAHTALQIETITSGFDPTIHFVSAHNSAGMYLDGTTDNKINFYNGNGKGAAGKEITFDNNGNVGIGTSSPAAGLQVSKGLLNAGGPAAGASTAAACFGNSSSDDNYGLVLGADGLGKGYISAQRTDGTATTYDLFIQPNGGSVGIGTTDPLTTLHVEGTAKFTDYVYGGAAGKLYINDDVAIVAGKKLYLDTGSNTYLHEASADTMAFITDGSERMRIGSSGGITISNSPANTGEAYGQPDMSTTTEGGIHFTSGGSQTSKGITWEAGGNGQTQAGIVCHNNDGNGTHLGFFTTYSYAAGPLCQMKLDQYGSLVLGASIDVTTVNSPSQHNAIFVTAGDIVVDSAHGNVELSDLLPGYTRGDYNCVKSSGSNLYFAVNGSYVSYINHSGTYTISDSRLKENVTTLTGSLEKIKQLRGVNFTWADTESRGSDTHLGFLAQEVEPHFPEAVGDGGLPNPNDENDEPYKNVSYATLVPALVEAIKELSSELDAAKARIEILENA